MPAFLNEDLNAFEIVDQQAHALITFVVVGYAFDAEWHIMINSLLMQRRFTSTPSPSNPTPPTVPEDRWVAYLINDGPDTDAERICSEYVFRHPGHFVYVETPTRFNDWGHTLRGLGLDRCRTPYFCTQNADNYLTPMFVASVIEGFEEPLLTPLGRAHPDVVVFDIVHNYANVNNGGEPPYSVLDVSGRRNRCDAGSMVVRTAVAQNVGWRSLAADSDGTFIDDLVRAHAKVHKIPGVLAVHN